MHLGQMLDETRATKAHRHAGTTEMASSDWRLQMAHRRSVLHDLREKELTVFLQVSRIYYEYSDFGFT